MNEFELMCKYKCNNKNSTATTTHPLSMKNPGMAAPDAVLSHTRCFSACT